MITLHRSCSILRIVDEKTCQCADMMTISGQRQRCEGVGRVQLRVCNSDSVVVDVYIVDFKPLGSEFILGINGISAQSIFPSLATRFEPAKTDEKPVCAGATKVEKPECAGATKVEKPVCVGGDAIEIDEPDFGVSCDATEKAWTVTWKWSADAESHVQGDRVFRPDYCRIEQRGRHLRVDN